MLTLEFASKLNTNFRACEILHLLTKKWEFFGAWAEIYEFDAYDRCAIQFPNTYHKWVFVVHVLLVNFMSKLMNVCLMKTQFSDGRADTQHPQWFWCLG
jgi:hypothetical protein